MKPAHGFLFGGIVALTLVLSGCEGGGVWISPPYEGPFFGPYFGHHYFYGRSFGTRHFVARPAYGHGFYHGHGGHPVAHGGHR
jgi:hypothetical protein